MATQILRVAEEVSGITNNEVADSYVPESGKEVIIDHFSGEAAFDPNVAVLLVWDYEGAGEDVLWTVKGSSKMPFKLSIPAADVDGVKKLAVVCINDMGVGSAYLSGYAEARQV